MTSVNKRGASISSIILETCSLIVSGISHIVCAKAKHDRHFWACARRVIVRVSNNANSCYSISGWFLWTPGSWDLERVTYSGLDIMLVLYNSRVLPQGWGTSFPTREAAVSYAAAICALIHWPLCNIYEILVFQSALKIAQKCLILVYFQKYFKTLR